MKALQIVCFDVPLPANYGGVIDVFYRIKALHNAGVSLVLHVFEYGRGQSVELDQYAHKVIYYKRYNTPSRLLTSVPFIVSSRKNEELLNELAKREAPILFEGLHCCAYLNHPKLKNHKKYVRAHNIEHNYYQNLAEAERGFFRKVFFQREARKLQNFESVLQFADGVLAISRGDEEVLKRRYNEVYFLPPAHPFTLSQSTQKSNFALYQGNLAVSENEEAAMWLLEKVWLNMQVPLVIAGAKPSKALSEAILTTPNVQLAANPSQDEMDELLSEARVQVIPGFRVSGVKLKFLAALFSGSPVITTPQMVEGTDLEALCHVAKSPNDFKEKVLACMEDNQSANLDQSKLVPWEINNQVKVLKKVIE